MTRIVQISVGLILIAFTASCGETPVSPSAPGAGPVTTGGTAAKPASAIPATAVFRCNDESCAGPDRVRGDGAPYPAQIGSDGNLMLHLPSPSRFITFDYSECLEPCPTGRRWFTTYQAGRGHALTIHTSVLVPGTETEVQHGMLAIPVGATWSSRIKMGYSVTAPDGAVYTWGNRFNPFFPGSTNLRVTRVSENQWEVEATREHRAWSVSIGGSKRNVTEVFEGNYLLPFRITVTK
jgi:hypothetical protein